MPPIRQNFMFMPPMWRIANFADGKGEDCDGSDIPKNSERTLLPRYQQMVVFVSFGSFNDLMKMGIRRRFRMHQGVQPYAYTKTWLRSAIKISGRPPSAAPEKNSKQWVCCINSRNVQTDRCFQACVVKRKPFFRTGAPEVEATEMKLVDRKPKIHQKQGRRSIPKVQETFCVPQECNNGADRPNNINSWSCCNWSWWKRDVYAGPLWWHGMVPYMPASQRKIPMPCRLAMIWKIHLDGSRIVFGL